MTAFETRHYGARDADAVVDAVAGQPQSPATEEDYRTQIGRRARVRRVGLRLTQDEVAKAAGVTRNFVSAIERGSQGLDTWRLRQLADALDVPLSWLLALPDREPGQARLTR